MTWTRNTFANRRLDSSKSLRTYDDVHDSESMMINIMGYRVNATSLNQMLTKWADALKNDLSPTDKLVKEGSIQLSKSIDNIIGALAFLPLLDQEEEIEKAITNPDILLDMLVVDIGALKDDFNILYNVVNSLITTLKAEQKLDATRLLASLFLCLKSPRTRIDHNERVGKWLGSLSRTHLVYEPPPVTSAAQENNSGNSQSTTPLNTNLSSLFIN